MNTSIRAPFYDLFKLIVAIILLLLFLFLFFGMRPRPAPPPDSIPATPTSQPSLPQVVPTSTELPLIETPVPAAPVTPSQTSTPAPTETQSPTLTPATIPSPTETPVPPATPTPAAETTEETNACKAVASTQLQVGTQATIIRHLNFRASPGFLNNWILTNNPGTQVEILGGPECTRTAGGGAYRWWQIKLPDGRVGWSAEASASGAFYFMEPTP